MAFVQNEQVACVILEDKGGNEHTKEKGAMHFNIANHAYCGMPV